MNTPPKIADYTTRKSYHQTYAANNREAINARKREWRALRARSSKVVEHPLVPGDSGSTPDAHSK